MRVCVTHGHYDADTATVNKLVICMDESLPGLNDVAPALKEALGDGVSGAYYIHHLTRVTRRITSGLHVCDV